jgi:SAM-dependent methyltransferase
MMTSWWTYDFGYSWPLTYGHVLVFALGGALAAASYWWQWGRWLTIGSALFAVWGLFGTISMHSAIQINEPQRLPTAAFLSGGSGRVLDLGAGSGRATVGLLLARPRASVVAVDLYEGYYGIDDNTPDRLRMNATVAGVEDRLEVQVADMRRLPFQSGEFDAAISVAAIDHLPWDGIGRALQETARVLKPGGQLLIVSLDADAWVRVAMPWSMHGHGFWSQRQNGDRWNQMLEGAGFAVTEAGYRPATRYVLATRR